MAIQPYIENYLSTTPKKHYEFLFDYINTTEVNIFRLLIIDIFLDDI